MPSGKRRTHEEFLSELEKISTTISIVGRYNKNTEPIHSRCLVCGYEWFPTPKSLLIGHGCPRCAGNIKLTHEQFIEKLKDTNPNYEIIDVLSLYEGMSGRIKCRCRVCNTVWSPKANDLIRAQSGCPACSGKIAYTHERFIENFIKKNPNATDILILSQYDGMLSPVNCKCLICGCEWAPIASSLIQGTGCPDCAKKRTAERGREVFKNLKHPGIISHKTFVDKFKNASPNSSTIEIIGTYEGANKPIKCKCLQCGNEWNPLASSLVQGSRCPNCSHTSTSFMEQFLFYAFRKFLGENEVINRDKSLIGKEIDIFIPSKAYAIEIGSWKWHKGIFERDKAKVKACEEKNVRLILIYDSCNDETVENEKIWTFPIDLGSEGQFTTLKTIVFKCLSQMNVLPASIDQNDWAEITSLAYQNSLRISHDEFLAKLKKKNPHFQDIYILTEYKYARDKVLCKCKTCGNIWRTAASELLKGTGCPVCQIKAVGASRSKKEQILEWRKKNPNGSKMLCEKETGISRMTVYKWWGAGS